MKGGRQGTGATKAPLGLVQKRCKQATGPLPQKKNTTKSRRGVSSSTKRLFEIQRRKKKWRGSVVTAQTAGPKKGGGKGSDVGGARQDHLKRNA